MRTPQLPRRPLADTVALLHQPGVVIAHDTGGNCSSRVAAELGWDTGPGRLLVDQMLSLPSAVPDSATSAAPSWLSSTTAPVASSRIVIRNRSLPPPPPTCPSTAVSRKR